MRSAPLERRAARRSARPAPGRSSMPPSASAAISAGHSDCGDQRCRRRYSLSTCLHGVVRRDAERRDKFVHRLRHAAGARRPSASACRACGSLRAITSWKVMSAAAAIAAGERAAERAVRVVGGLRAARRASARSSSCVGRGVVEHLEARRDIGLERKLVQQPRAEGVDGLHLQPARRLQRRREQPARARRAASASVACAGARA